MKSAFPARGDVPLKCSTRVVGSGAVAEVTRERTGRPGVGGPLIAVDLVTEHEILGGEGFTILPASVGPDLPGLFRRSVPG